MLKKTVRGLEWNVDRVKTFNLSLFVKKCKHMKNYKGVSDPDIEKDFIELTGKKIKKEPEKK